MVGLDEDYEITGFQRIDIKSNKGPQSKERKMSNEDICMLPPRANNCEMLRPSKFSFNTTIPSKFENDNQQALKPMTILGFLKKSCTDKLIELPRMEGIEKADVSLHALSLISGTIDEVGAKLPTLITG